MRTTTVNMGSEVNRLREERIPMLESKMDELVDQYEEEFESYEDVPEAERKAFDKLDEKVVEARGKAETFEYYIEEWNGSKFVIQELDTGAIAEVQDEVSEASFEFDVEEGELEGGTPKQGYGMVETLRKAVVQQPEGAPTYRDAEGNFRPAPGEYPHQIGLWLFEQVNNFNTVGDTDLGNSSLREEMTS